MPPLRPSLRGTLASTTSTSATVPLVVHSLRPLSRYPEPSSVGVAVVDTLAGSEPTPGSVSANADRCVRGDLRQPLALLLLRAEQQQRLRQPDRLVRREQRREAGVPGPGEHHRAVVVDLREPEAAVLLGHLHAQRADLLEPVDHFVGDLAVALDRLRIDVHPAGTRRASPGTARPSRPRRPASPAGGRSARAGSRPGRGLCRSWAASSPSPELPLRSLELLCSRHQQAWQTPHNRWCG